MTRSLVPAPIIDGCQYCNWSEKIFRQLREGGVDAIHVTVCYHEDFRETVYTAGVVAEIHPRAGSGLHLIGGLGWSGYRAGNVDADPDELGFHYNAPRLRLGIGWDLPLGASWSVGNRVTLDASSLGTLTNEGAPVANAVGLSLVRFGIYLRRR